MRFHCGRALQKPLSTLWFVLAGASKGAAFGFVTASIAVCAKIMHRGSPTAIAVDGDYPQVLAGISNQLVQDETDTYTNCKVILFSTAAGAGVGAVVGFTQAIKHEQNEDPHYQPMQL